jgi:hypothetical protein
MLHAGLRLLKSLQFFWPTLRLVILACCMSARLPGKTASQGCGARLPGKAAGQGCRARLPGKPAGQGCRTKLPGKAAGQCCRAMLQYAESMVKLDSNEF